LFRKNDDEKKLNKVFFLGGGHKSIKITQSKMAQKQQLVIILSKTVPKMFNTWLPIYDRFIKYNTGLPI